MARRWAPLAVLAAAAIVVVHQGWLDYLTLESIAIHRQRLAAEVEANRALALAAYFAVYVAVVALSLPGGIFLTLLGGFLFGWLVGGLVTVIAATCGATAVFLIARTSLGAFLAERAGAWLERLRAGFARNSVSYLLFLRLVPAFPFWLVNIAPALLGMPLSRYVLATFIGIIPGTFAFAFVGAGLDSLIEAQQAAYDDCRQSTGNAGTDSSANAGCTFTLEPASLLTNELIAAFVALGVVALIPVVLRWRRPETNADAAAKKGDGPGRES